jgi:hypothetical protein
MKGTRNVPPTDWIPGDWGYIGAERKNPPPGGEGENIIYLGNDQYWGLGPAPNIRTLAEWQKFVGSWSGAGEKPIYDKRDYPTVGLQK